MTGDHSPPVLNGATAESAHYVVRVEDHVAHPLAGHDGCRYVSPPQTRSHAIALVEVLMGCPLRAIDEHGPWRSAIAGGQRTISLQPARPDGQLPLDAAAPSPQAPVAGHPRFPDSGNPNPKPKENP